jgi:hypothetical protein
MAKTQEQIDRIHASRTAVPGRIYTGPNGVRYSGSRLGHLTQEANMAGDVVGTTLQSKVNSLGKYSISEVEELLDGIRDEVPYFEFTQGVAAATWDIAHNLGKKPSIMVVDSGDNVVEGSEVYIYPKSRATAKVVKKENKDKEILDWAYERLIFLGVNKYTDRMHRLKAIKGDPHI